MIDNIGKYLSEVIEAVYGDRLKNFISRNPAINGSSRLIMSLAIRTDRTTCCATQFIRFSRTTQYVYGEKFRAVFQKI